jgi:thymidylate kinase
MPKESLSIFLDVPPNIACRLLEDRKFKQADPDETTDHIDLQKRIYNEYQRMTTADPEHFIKIDCCAKNTLLEPKVIADRVWQAVSTKFPQLRTRNH